MLLLKSINKESFTYDSKRKQIGKYLHSKSHDLILARTRPRRVSRSSQHRGAATPTVGVESAL